MTKQGTVTKRRALGGDALDALMSGGQPETTLEPPAPPAPPSPAVPTVEPARLEGAVEAAPIANPAGVAEPDGREMDGRPKRGRPRGPGYGEPKSTRWVRSDGEPMRSRSVHIPVELDHLLRRRAAEQDCHVGAIIVEALEAYLKGS